MCYLFFKVAVRFGGLSSGSCFESLFPSVLRNLETLGGEA